MIPIRLQISGFLSYGEPTELDFTSFDLACISGANGAGKSSLLDAITWVLFGQARRKDETIINSNAQTAEVILEFSYEDEIFKVQRSKTRGKSTLLEFQAFDGRTWKPLTEHSVSETETRICQTLRLDYETFINASFFLQGKADLFAQQKATDRKRILSTILGLEIWEEYRERAATRRRNVENELFGLQSALQEIDAELNEEDQRRQQLKTLEEELARAESDRKLRQENLDGYRRLQASLVEQQRMVEMLAAQAEASRTGLNNLQVELAQRYSERSGYQEYLQAAEQTEASHARWQGLVEELARWESIAVNFREHEKERSVPLLAIQSEQARLEEEKRGLGQQRSQNEELEKALPALQKAAEDAHNAIVDLQARLSQRDQISSALYELQQHQAEAQAENQRLKAEMDGLKERIDQLKESRGALCPLCGQPLNAEERQRLVTELNARGKEMADQYRANQSFLKDFNQQWVEKERALSSLAQLENELRQQQRIFDQMEDKRKQNENTLDHWKNNGALRLAELEGILSRQAFALEARQTLADIDARLKQIGYDSAAHDSVRKAELEARASQEAMRLLEKARAALAPLQREIERLEEQAAGLQSELNERQALHQKASAAWQEASSALPDMEALEKEVNQLREVENRKRMEVGGARQRVDILKTLKARRVEKEKQKEAVSRQFSNLKQLEKAFSKDGVPALLIEQALPEIEAQANDILDRLSNGSMSISFDTQKKYKDKKREDKKETLDILISDSAGTREYELFSGGEAFRVNFAIRLALSRILAQRAGARLQTLVIDEGFGSQDANGRQRLIEAINAVRADFQKVLVITHMEELKDFFPARVEVEKSAHGSRLSLTV